jgi:hypothetical protein
MSAYQLTDFSDIYTAILEELKVQASDTNTLNRIKRMINMIYIDEVVPANRWYWLYGNTSITHKAYYTGGTVAVTPGSTTATISVAPTSAYGDSGSFLNHSFSVDGTNEVYKITAHTALATTFTIDQEFNGVLATAAGFKIWKDSIPLPTDCRETIEAWHDFKSSPMDGFGLQEMRKLMASQPKAEGRPYCYSTYDYFDPSSGDDETESDRYRVFKVYPAISTLSTIVKVDYVKEVAALENSGDEPLMPIEDRIVLFYGALSLAWGSINRNPEEAARNRQLFEAKLARMMAKVQDSMDKPRLEPASTYVVAKRGPRISRGARGSGNFAGGQSSYSAPSYLSGVTINGALLTGNVTANSGVTIDGRDLSIDGAANDAHIAASTNVHGLTGGASVVGDTQTQTLTNKTIAAGSNTITGLTNTAISASAAIAYSKLNLALSILNADISASAAIAYSKLALTGAILNADLAGSIAYSKLSLTGAILNADLAGSIAYSKLSLTGAILNADISASAAIAYSKLALTGAILNADLAGSIALTKLAATTVSRALVSDGSGVITPATTTAVEIGYVNGVTSAIQTQMNLKAPLAGPTFTGTVTTPVTASRALVTGASSELAAATTTATEIGYVNGVTSAIQTQLNTLAVYTPYYLGNLGLACSVSGNALTIALKQADGSTNPASGSGAVKVAFRSSTLTDGLYNIRSITGALSVVVSSGSTLGHKSATAHNIYVYLVDNSGTPELAVSTTLYKENRFITTVAEGGAGAADTNNIVYSTTARSSQPHRLIAVLISTQTTAGTWAAVPTTTHIGLVDMQTIETVGMRATSASTTLTYNTEVVAVNGTVSFDTHNAYNSSTGVWTCPVAGKYAISAQIFSTTAITPVVARSFTILVYKDAGAISRSGLAIQATGAAAAWRATVNDVAQLSAGETISIKGFGALDASTANVLSGNAIDNYLSIMKIGD